MNRLFRTCVARLAAFLPEKMRGEEGTATMEFVLVLPLIMAVFMASFESGLLMTRTVMLEQSVDMTMRDLRLGHYPNANSQVLKRQICSRTIIFPDCENNIKIELNRVSTATWTMPVTPPHCINRRQAIEPVVTMNVGQQNDLMLVRVCVVLNAMFPSTGIALNLPLDSDGGYAIVTRTAFSIEPS